MRTFPLLIAAGFVLLAGCSDSSSFQTPLPVATPPVVDPDPVESEVSFTEFVRKAVAVDPDAEPLDFDESLFIFDADDDPAAFDDLLSQGS